MKLAQCADFVLAGLCMLTNIWSRSQTIFRHTGKIFPVWRKMVWERD